MTTATEQLWQVCEDYLAAEQLELDDLEVVGTGPRVVRVTVDADGGVGVDRLARVSRALSRILDESEPFDDPYTLEVSSPGLERALKRPRHYEKAIGREIKVKTRDEVDGARTHQGELASVHDGGFEMTVDGGGRRLAYDQVQSARTMFEWKKTPKPGQKSG